MADGGRAISHGKGTKLEYAAAIWSRKNISVVIFFHRHLPKFCRISP